MIIIILLWSEIGGNCQNESSVPVSAELRFLSATMWHNYVLTKHLITYSSETMRIWRRNIMDVLIHDKLYSIQTTRECNNS